MTYEQRKQVKAWLQDRDAWTARMITLLLVAAMVFGLLFAMFASSDAQVGISGALPPAPHGHTSISDGGVLSIVTTSGTNTWTGSNVFSNATGTIQAKTLSFSTEYASGTGTSFIAAPAITTVTGERYLVSASLVGTFQTGTASNAIRLLTDTGCTGFYNTNHVDLGGLITNAANSQNGMLGSSGSLTVMGIFRVTAGSSCQFFARSYTYGTGAIVNSMNLYYLKLK